MALCPTSKNPADISTRVISADAFLNSDWLTGPDFLLHSENFWPEPPPNLPLHSDFSVSCSVSAVSDFAISDSFVSQSFPLDYFICYFSCLYKLKKATAWIIRCRDFLLSKVRQLSAHFNLSRLTVDELKSAELFLIKFVQQQHFSDIFLALTSNDKSSKFVFLSLCLTYSFRRNSYAGGRLQCPVSESLKHSIILPSSSHITDLITVTTTATRHGARLFKTEISVLKGGATVRRVGGKCVLCRKRGSLSVNNSWLTCHSPSPSTGTSFSHVGIDYFGPLLVKQGRSVVKRHGCILSVSPFGLST